MSRLFRVLSNSFNIDGGLAAENLANLASQSRSVLYLCLDEGDDLGIPGGFSAIKTAIPNATHIPFDTAKLKDLSYSVALYHKLELALHHLPSPCSIVCKSSARASAVYAAVQGIRNKTPVSDLLESSKEQNLPFVSKEPITNWVKTVYDHIYPSSGLLFRQLFEAESSTYTYLLADNETKDAILIDPVLETVARDAKLVAELGLTLRFVLNTHVHADHVTGTGQLKTLVPGCQSVISAVSEAQADVALQEFEPVFFGKHHVYGLSTPGHTKGCFTYVLNDQSQAFTGDTLLIRGCGRTDFQGGNAGDLYHSVHDKIFKLPRSTALFPAHDYKGMTSTSVEEEITHNPRLTKSQAEFETIMANLNLPYPKKFDESVPKNLRCGV